MICQWNVYRWVGKFVRRNMETIYKKEKKREKKRKGNVMKKCTQLHLIIFIGLKSVLGGWISI